MVIWRKYYFNLNRTSSQNVSTSICVKLFIFVVYTSHFVGRYVLQGAYAAYKLVIVRAQRGRFLLMPQLVCVFVPKLATSTPSVPSDNICTVALFDISSPYPFECLAQRFKSMLSFENGIVWTHRNVDYHNRPRAFTATSVDTLRKLKRRRKPTQLRFVFPLQGRPPFRMTVS